MKHLFLVHSHITHEVALAIIRRESIAPQDAILLLDRKFEAKLGNIRAVPLDLPDEYFLIYKNPLRGWYHLSCIRQFIDNLASDQFVFYFPHTFSDFANIGTSHPRCVGYSLMEEGLGSYFLADRMNKVVPPAILGWKQRVLSKVLYGGYFSDRYFFRGDYLLAYCTSEHAFPDLARKVVLEIEPFEGRRRVGNLSSFERKVIVLDSVVETRMVAEEDFMAGFDKLLKVLIERLREGEVVYFKRHPYQYVKREFSDHLIEYIKDRIPGHQFEELSGDVSLEWMAGDVGVELYLNISSVSIYASRLGARVYSCAKSVGSSSPEFMRYLEGVPAVFHESVEFV